MGVDLTLQNNKIVSNITTPISTVSNILSTTVSFTTDQQDFSRQNVNPTAELQMLNEYQSNFGRKLKEFELEVQINNFLKATYLKLAEIEIENICLENNDEQLDTPPDLLGNNCGQED